MSTEVELFEFQDIPSRPSIRGYVGTDGAAKISAGGVDMPTYATDSAGSVTGLVGPGGKQLLIGPSSINKSVLTIGGDHPYKQWWGSDNNGLGRMFADLGISPYLAICADESIDHTSGYGATLGKTEMLTVAQAQTLQSQGVEFVSHGARHAHFWELANTGIRVWYTGAEATPTVNISTTQLTTSTATTGATNFAFATYPTLSALRTAIMALAGWNCELATELLGTEPSASMMPLNAARSVVPLGGSDTTDSNQRFALSGGIMIRYSGTAYKDVSISVNDGSNFFSIFADGARLIAQSTSATLTTIVTAINALNVTGLTALVMDNGYAAQTVAGSSTLNPGQKQRETYCFGDELGTVLHRIGQMRSINHYGIQCSGGIGHNYTFLRQIKATKERAAALYGITLNSFAQSGGRFWPWHTEEIADEHVSWRGNRSYTELYSGISPHAMPANHAGKFTGHFTSISASASSTPYTEADVLAVIDAMGDGGGWVVNWLNHLCTPTPNDASGYTLNVQSPSLYTSSADQDEGPYVREVKYAAALRDAGRIEILAPTEAEYYRLKKRAPSNLVFNPKFRNGRSNNILGITTVLQGNGGMAMPGWAVSTSSSDWAQAAIADGALTLQTVGALGSNKTPIGCMLTLEPGKTYSIGMFMDLTNWGSANSVRLNLYAIHNGMGDGNNIGQTFVSSHPAYGGTIGVAKMLFTVPPRKNPAPAYVRGIAGPFSFGGTDSITLNIDNQGASAAIAVNGLTTAKAVAAAINTAIAADAAYTTLSQYHNCARAENNRLIIEAPHSNSFPNDSGSIIQLANSVGTPLATLFGAGVSTVRAVSHAHADIDTTMIGYRMTVVPSSTSAQQTMVLSAPFCRKIEG